MADRKTLEGGLKRMLLLEAVQKARRVLGSVRGVQFSEVPVIDVSDRAALLTVVAGLREVAAFGFGDKNNSHDLEALEKIVEQQGLHCLVTRRIRHNSTNDRLRDIIGDLCQVSSELTRFCTGRTGGICSGCFAQQKKWRRSEKWSRDKSTQGPYWAIRRVA